MTDMTWGPTTLAAVLRQSAAEAPRADALVHEAARLSREQLARLSARLARALLANGVRRGQVVATFMPNGFEWAALFCALGKIGAAAVPINIRYQAPEMAYVLEQCGAELLVCAARHRDRDLTATITEAVSIAKTPRVVVMGGTVSAGQTRSTWDTFLEAGESLPAEALANAAAAVDEHDLLLVQYTSGTTAFPKGVELRQGQLLRSGRAMASRLGLGSEDRFFSPMPFFHIGGSTASLITALVSGATLVFQDQFDAAGALEALERERCTCACGVDTMFVDMLAQPGFDAKKLCVRTGWTLYNAAVFAAFPGMMQVYALSECSSVVTICDWRDPFERRRDTCGYPIEGTEVRIVDIESLAPLPPDTPGRILVRGWCTTSGYFRQPEQTAHLLIDDRWLDTGDYGRVLESGDLIFMGRLKDVLRVGGENVASAEVEAVLNAHPAVLRSAVVPLPHPRLKEVPLAFVQLRPGSEVSAQALSDHCASRLAPFKVPRQVEFVSAFTMTESGKIIKRTLVEQVQRTARASA